ncbi:DHHA1 domain-containing protein, partial [Hydrogenoanaerobacterium sp.]|uniref:single-stranded-DNA-specific exonuclease RecJ n=1 Tax=Hydrogenoanaerobacterium sp. TaxID=2953763 RepID=UPI0028A293FA
VGVVFKLICALEGGDGIELLDYYGDLTCIGTIADIVSLTGENRTIVRYGLERLQYTDNVGLRALLEVSGLLDKRITCENVGFILAPRINAAGRMGFTQKAVDLLLCEDEEEALELAALITEQNKARQEIEAKILKDISSEIAKTPGILYERLLVLSGEGWHHGIIGIVCSKIMERYAKPCLLISVDGDEARGSGRSIEGFSLVDAIAKCGKHLTRYGGHTLAAGFSLNTVQIANFKEQLLTDAKNDFDSMPVMAVKIDRELSPQELTVDNLKKLTVLEPFGTDNETPVFAVLGAQIEAIYPMGSDGGHIRIRLRKDGQSFYAVYFGMSQERFAYAVGDTIDIAANCDVNVYNNEERVSVKIKTIRPTGINQAPLFDGVQQYDRYRRREGWSEETRERNVPTRNDIAVIYRWLREQKGYSGDLEVLYCKLAPQQIGYCKLRLALDVMAEMGLIRCLHTKFGVAITLCAVNGKIDLEQSKILQAL